MATLPITAVLIVAGLLYVRGWVRLRRTIPLWRAASFVIGLISIWLAAASPLAMLDHHLLTAHMVQHLLLLTIAPALILMGFPAIVFPLRTPGRPHPVVCWCAASSVLIFWHIPAVFALTFGSVWLHYVQHVSFVIAGLLFWQPVIASRPGELHQEWSVVIYLFAATLPCDVLSAFLSFCGRVVYPAYLNMPPHFGLTALEDQECAGALMWTVVTLAYFIPAVLVTMALLSQHVRPAVEHKASMTA